MVWHFKSELLPYEHEKAAENIYALQDYLGKREVSEVAHAASSSLLSTSNMEVETTPTEIEFQGLIKRIVLFRCTKRSPSLRLDLFVD